MPIACVGALLLALLLTGCGKAGTAPEDGGPIFRRRNRWRHRRPPTP
ncbi:MAG: hypothetical protein ACLTYN_01275 [Dysosmobacter welbionis]